MRTFLQVGVATEMSLGKMKINFAPTSCPLMQINVAQHALPASNSFVLPPSDQMEILSSSRRITTSALTSPLIA